MPLHRLDRAQPRPALLDSITSTKQYLRSARDAVLSDTSNRAIAPALKWRYVQTVMPATISSADVWREIEKHFFAVLSFVTSRGEARSAGIVYTVRDRNVHIVTENTSWKVRHILANPHVSLTVTIPKRVPFMPWIPIPPATITFQGDASIHDIKEAPPEIIQKLLRGLKLSAEEMAALCIIKVRPAGEFVTYGVGVSMQTMRKPEAARGRAPV